MIPNLLSAIAWAVGVASFIYPLWFKPMLVLTDQFLYDRFDFVFGSFAVMCCGWVVVFNALPLAWFEYKQTLTNDVKGIGYGGWIVITTCVALFATVSDISQGHFSAYFLLWMILNIFAGMACWIAVIAFLHKNNSRTENKKEKKDLLERGVILTSLKQCIDSAPVDEGSFVIGLYGAWGSGKSFVTDLLKHQYEKQEDVIFLQFTASAFSSESAIIRGLYETIENGFPSNSAFLKRALCNYGRSLAECFKAPSIGSFFGSAGSFDQHKNELAKELRLADDKRIVVVVDDIDRLEESEARAVLRAVRNNLDLPRIVFIVSCDPDKVLSFYQGNAGQLEKILNCSLHLPMPTVAQILDYLRDPVVKVVTAATGSEDIAKGTMDLFSDVLAKGAFERVLTLRWAKLLVNQLETYPKDIMREVRPLDIILLEALRLFSPVAWSDISMNESLYLGTRQVFKFGVEAKERRKEELAELKQHLTNLVGGHHMNACFALMEELFPEVFAALKYDPISRFDEERARVEKRVANSECFEKYFFKAVLPNMVSDGHVEKLYKRWNSLGVDEAVEDMVTIFKESPLNKELFFQALLRNCSIASSSTAESMVLALSRLGLRWHDGSREQFGQAKNLFFDLLEKRCLDSDVAKIYMRCLREGTSLDFTAACIAELAIQPRYKKTAGLVDFNEAKKFGVDLLTRIFVKEGVDVFVQYPDSAVSLLRYWANEFYSVAGGKKAEVSNYIWSRINSCPQNLLMIANYLSGPGDHGYYISNMAIEFLDIDVAVVNIEGLITQGVYLGKELEKISSFRDACKQYLEKKDIVSPKNNNEK